MTDRVQRLVERGQLGREFRHALAALSALGPVGDLGGQRHLASRVGEIDDSPRPGLQAFARSYEHLPPGQLVRARLGSAAFPQQKHLCRTARAALGAQKARRHDAGLVGDQQVAGAR